MLNEIVTVAQKDLKEVLTSRGSLRSGLTYLFIILAIMGVLMPLQTGPEWFTEPFVPVVWSWFPVLMVISVVTDSFAGERERNTLETLLASCLSDRGILFGKIAASVVYGYSISLLGNLLAAITVNVAFSGGSIQFYSPTSILALLVIPLLACLLIAAAGVLVSLNAPTARAAYQRMSVPMIVVFIIPLVISNAAGEEEIQRFFSLLQTANQALLAGIVLALVLAVTAALIAVALNRFRRAKLILD